MKRKNILLIGLLVLAVTYSCDKLDSLDDYKDVDPGKTATMPLNGEYWVTLDLYDSTAMTWVRDYYGADYTRIMLYNTSTNQADSMWIDDLGFWPTKCKIACDPKNKAFLPSEVHQADITDADVKVFLGSLITNGAITSGGNVTDSIVIELEWADDPGFRYRYAGYRRTGFLEDDH